MIVSKKYEDELNHAKELFEKGDPRAKYAFRKVGLGLLRHVKSSPYPVSNATFELLIRLIGFNSEHLHTQQPCNWFAPPPADSGFSDVSAYFEPTMDKTLCSEVSEAAADTPAELESHMPVPVTPPPKAVEDIRVLIGKDAGKKEVYWEFGHPAKTNRFMLISGHSGSGKTYAIESILYEMSKQEIPSFVFDYSNSFTFEKMEPLFRDSLKGKIKQRIAILDKIPVNPFKQHTDMIGGCQREEPPAIAAARFAMILKECYHFGEQQYSLIYKACMEGITRYKSKMDFAKFKMILEASQASTVLSKMHVLFDMDLFDSTNAYDWKSITDRSGQITIIQLTGLDQTTQSVVTNILMWDAWYALTKCGNPSRPFVAVFDEAQNLSFKDGSAAQKILTEGRKFGWSAIFSTQFLNGAMSSGEISRLQQASETLYFRPTSKELPWVAQQISGGQGPDSWKNVLMNLVKGCCIVAGDGLRSDGSFGACPARSVKVASFEDRLSADSDEASAHDESQANDGS